MDTKVFRVYIWLHVTSFPPRYFVRVIRNFPNYSVSRAESRDKTAFNSNLFESSPPFRSIGREWSAGVSSTFKIGSFSRGWRLFTRLSTLSNQWFPRFMNATCDPPPDNCVSLHRSKSRIERAEIRHLTAVRQCVSAHSIETELNNLAKTETKFSRWKFSPISLSIARPRRRILFF